MTILKRQQYQMRITAITVAYIRRGYSLVANECQHM
jgi:hypothetical protein